MTDAKHPVSPESDSPGETAGPKPSLTPGGIPPRKFAVPESPEARRESVVRRVIVPEASEESEEALIHAPRWRKGSILERPERFEIWFVLLLFLASSFTVLLGNSNTGMAWDEAYYVEAGQKTKTWLRMWLSGAQSSASPEMLDRFWNADRDEPRGHPSVTRLLVAAGMMAGSEGKSPLWAMRAPIAFCFGLTLAALFALMRRSYGPVTAWITVLSYFFMPRVFGHAHFALTETPMALMTVAVVYAFLRGLKDWRWSVMTGALFGVALATKANALLLLPILLPWAFFFHRRDSLNNLYALLFVSPLALVAVWPYLWHEPIKHFLEYLDWNFTHRQLGLWYYGNHYPSPGHPFVPWDYAPRLLVLTLPLAILSLGILGVARTLRAPIKHSDGLLFLWAAALPCLVMMFKSAPKYDGVRLFLPALPFVAALAGIGGGVLIRIAAFYERSGRRTSVAKTVLVALILLIAFDGGWALLSSGPNYLSYFNPLIRGRKGAAGKLEITYWGEALNPGALDAINRMVPDGATLSPRAMNIEVLRYYQAWGWLKRGITLVEDRPGDYHLLQYRFGFFGLPDELLAFEFEKDRIAVFPPKGVPLIGLYRTSPEFLEELRIRRGR